ncbi:hypothetical protein BGI32_01835 [Snodgrassella alvi]|uniref:Uncharacterized protein n=1 Tax=Snodgrassella alvi TaxID=1196083 RepID=A0A2N9WW62_9NEIS|nr:hypothetical protein BGI32_01835 [Snodgrassella alvi]
MFGCTDGLWCWVFGVNYFYLSNILFFVLLVLAGICSGCMLLVLIYAVTLLMCFDLNMRCSGTAINRVDGDGCAWASDGLIDFFYAVGAGKAVAAFVLATGGLAGGELADGAFSKPESEHLFHGAFLYLKMAR